MFSASSAFEVTMDPGKQRSNVAARAKKLTVSFRRSRPSPDLALTGSASWLSRGSSRPRGALFVVRLTGNSPTF